MLEKNELSCWKEFVEDKIPSSVNLYQILFKKIEPNQRIIDVGTGFGKVAFELLSDGYGPIVGIDINKNGIDFANKQLTELPDKYQGLCEFKQLNALDTGYDDNYFDHAIMQAFMTALCQPMDRIQVLKECRRIVKPSGGLYLAVFMQTWHSKTYRDKYEQGYKETGELGSFNVYDKDTGDLIYIAHHYTEKEISGLLLNAGFQIDYFNYEKFETRSGNIVNGAVIYAK